MAEPTTSEGIVAALAKRWPDDQYLLIPEAPLTASRQGRRVDFCHRWRLMMADVVGRLIAALDELSPEGWQDLRDWFRHSTPGRLAAQKLRVAFDEGPSVVSFERGGVRVDLLRCDLEQSFTALGIALTDEDRSEIVKAVYDARLYGNGYLQCGPLDEYGLPPLRRLDPRPLVITPRDIPPPPPPSGENPGKPSP